MTELYWQKYIEQVQFDPMHRKDPFWRGIQENLERKKVPKHHLELYSMCRSDNPYIRQVKNSPNITNQTVVELICREKSCELQYCLSLMKVATQNKRNQIDLKGCKEQYSVMRNCLSVERTNLIKRQQQLKNAVHGIKPKVEEVPVVISQEEQKKIYI